MSHLLLSSPLHGWVSSLDETPDAVFAQRMLGDGVAIDPLGSVLHAPCDGVVIAAPASRHAVSLRAGNGAEMLIHLGLETVGLGGAGFELHVAVGQAVKAGEALISFDLDALSLRARSLITPIVVTNPEAFAIVRRAPDGTVAVGDFLMDLAPVAAVEVAESAVRDQGEVARAVVVLLGHGLHARPAARIADCAKPFAADLALEIGARRANARSPIAVMALAVRHGDTVTVRASGREAEAAVAAIVALIAGGMGEAAALPAAEPVAVAPAPVAPAPVAASEPGLLRGVTAAPGLAIGPAVRWLAAEIVVAETSAGLEPERAALAAAVDTVRTRLATAAEAAGRHGQSARQTILAAHQGLLDDPDLAASADQAMAAGQSAGQAWRVAAQAQAGVLRGLGDPRLAERADDLIDLRDQVLRALSGQAEDAARVLPPGAILLADELLPSQLMGLDASRLGGLCTARGGPTSHVAILAAALGVPALVAVGPDLLAVAEGATLILDAEAGTLRVGPDAHQLAAAQTAVAARHQRQAAAQAAAHLQCRTADGARIKVYGNVGSLADAVAAAAQGAEGCGLLRSEFLFLERDTPPGEDEQAAQYQAIARALNGQPLIVRTLDVGGDKAAPYLPIPAEDNPALGLRGVRVSLWRPELLKTQLRAILRVEPPPGAKARQCQIMVPMIASLAELRAVRALLDEVQAELGITDRVALGVMIETPAAAVTADILAAEADFLSVGTNDLTQYVLAMDRGNAALASQIDALHPAVLRMIAQTCQGAAKHGRWVGVCGGLASDLLAAPILIGLGVSELSATAATVPRLKAVVRTLDLPACQALARQALELDSPQAVRALCQAFANTLSQAGAPA